MYYYIPFWCETLVNTPSKHVDPMLVQCWPTICDVGPTSNQHWFNVSCLLGCVQLSKHKEILSFVDCFGMFWKSKKLQVRDYLFKRTEFFRIKYVRSWAVGLPSHPQLRNYMTLSIMILVAVFCLFFRLLGLLKWARLGLGPYSNYYASPPSVMLAHIQRGVKHDTVTQYWVNVCSAS